MANINRSTGSQVADSVTREEFASLASYGEGSTNLLRRSVESAKYTGQSAR